MNKLIIMVDIHLLIYNYFYKCDTQSTSFTVLCFNKLMMSFLFYGVICSCFVLTNKVFCAYMFISSQEFSLKTRFVF